MRRLAVVEHAYIRQVAGVRPDAERLIPVVPGERNDFQLPVELVGPERSVSVAVIVVVALNRSDVSE